MCQIGRKNSVKLFVLLVFVAFGLFSACQKKTEAQRDGVVIADSDKYEASVFRSNCAVCHGPEANGKTIDGKRIPSLRTGEARTKSLGDIRSQIENGKLPMPPFRGQMTPEEIDNMSKFVYQDIQGRELKQ
ncbi:MAG: c-type cytochrome [Pyrinomonadaceae bacterium]